MINRIIQFSLNNRVMVLVASAVIAGLGIYLAGRMEIDVFPDLNAPTVVVMTEAAGMAAEEVERGVTFQIETAMNGAAGVRRVRSNSTSGFSVVWVEFGWETDILKARQTVSEKIAELSDALPPGAGRPVIGPQSSILGEMMIIGMVSDELSPMDLRTVAERVVRPRLLSVGGVSQVAVIGGDVKEWQIVVNTDAMRFYEVSIEDVLAATEEITANFPGGVANSYGNEYIVRGIMSVDDISALESALVSYRSGQPVTIGDIARVEVGPQMPRLGAASVETVPAVILTVTKQPGAATLDLTELIDNTIEELGATLTSVEFRTDIFRQAEFIEASVGNIRRALIEGAIFVIIILSLFLMNGRVTIISLTALPLSLLVSIIVLKLMGLTINTMSLGGMAIAIGSLVDDAVIDVENVFKRLKQNKARPAEEQLPILKVVYDASAEIRTSIVNATMITIVAFVPLFFLSGIEGRMLVPLGISFVVSLFASLLVAVTVTPVLCSILLNNNKTLSADKKEPFISRHLNRAYGAVLGPVLSHGRTVLIVTGALFAGAIIIFFTLGSSFLPPFNEGSLTINAATLPGVTLEESDKAGRRVEEILLGIPEIQTVARKTGRAELDEHSLGVNVSEIEAPFKLGKRKRAEFLADVREQLEQLPGMNIEIGQPISHRIDAMLSGAKANIAIKVFGPDLNKLISLGNTIKNSIEDIDGVADLNVEQLSERAQLQIRPRRELLSYYGISLPEFSRTVETLLSGTVVSQVFDGLGYIDVTVKAEEGYRENIEMMKDIIIVGSEGAKVPLSDVAEIVSSAGPNAIGRENVSRRIIVSVNTAGADLGGIVENIRRRIDSSVDMPEGYYVEYGGQFESRKSASKTLMLASLAALAVIFSILFLEFKKLSLSAMVMINLPLAMIGGVVAVRLASGVLSIPAIIGFISLLGIAVRNGILLISRYGQLQVQGLSLYDSVVKGSIDRLNPILMTALTSALALIPLAVNGSAAGNEIQSPMAQVILGGLLSSVLLNGFVVPTVYLMINKDKNR